MFPTKETYTELQTAYDFFNKELWSDQLPQCLITLQREKQSYGYFSRQRFVNAAGQKSDEIAMNPAYFAVAPAVEILQTLVHEMVHLWQSHFGSPGRRSYHNKEWADAMEGIGLMPSDTGKPGGRRVGEKMADYIIPGGRFEEACKKLLQQNFAITWKDRLPMRRRLDQVNVGAAQGIDPQNLDVLDVNHEVPESRSNRCKFTCPNCEINAWGKPGLKLICGECQLPLQHSGH